MTNIAKETYEKQMKDSNTIFTIISTSGAKNFHEANRIVVAGFIVDRTYSRAGISHALKRLEKFYGEKL